MPERCVIANCSNVKDTAKGISLHRIPFYEDERPLAKHRRRQWIAFVRGKRAKWEASKSSVICSNHFRPEDFERRYVSVPGMAEPLRAALCVDDIGVVSIPSINISEHERHPKSAREKRMVSANFSFIGLDYLAVAYAKLESLICLLLCLFIL